MRKTALALAFLLYALPGWAAITSVGTLGNANSVLSGTSLVITTGATLESGNCAAVAIANDNLGSGDGDNDDVTGVADSASNTWTQLGAEHSYGNGGAGNGANAALFVTKAGSELATGGTITITFAGAITAKVAQAWEYTCGTLFESAGSQQTEACESCDNGSLAISGLTSQEYLFLRVMARARDSTTNITATASHTSWGDFRASTGVDATSMRIDVEEIILTGTGDTSDPTFPSPGGSETASFLVAIRDVAPATRRPVAPIIFQ